MTTQTAAIHTPNPKPLDQSPWGQIQHVTHIADGIWQVHTASHGGIKLSHQRFAAMPRAWRSTPYSGDGWFEEDCDWAFVALAFPDAFSANEVEEARQTIERHYPQRLIATAGEPPPPPTA